MRIKITGIFLDQQPLTTKFIEGIVGFSTEIEANNSSTYVQRKAESRALDNRIYRLRYVIPKDFKGADIAKNQKRTTYSTRI